MFVAGAAGVLVGKKLPDGGVAFSAVKDEKADAGVDVLAPMVLVSLSTVEGVAAAGVLAWLLVPKPLNGVDVLLVSAKTEPADAAAGACFWAVPKKEEGLVSGAFAGSDAEIEGALFVGGC